MEDKIAIELGSSFLLNAGIIGFIRFLDDNEIDYSINGQVLTISKSFFKDNNIGEMFVHTVSKLLGGESKFADVLSKKNYVINLFEKEAESTEEAGIISLFEKKEELSDKTQKELTKLFKEFSDMIEKNSFIAGYEIINQYENVQKIDVMQVKQFKKEKDLFVKKYLYLQLIELLSQPIAIDVLIFKELMYSKIKLFYENTSFFVPAMLKTKIEDCYNRDFIEPLVDEFETTKAKKKRCIECSELSFHNKSISFMIDTTDDVARKKSAYWNCKPDAFVCPICALMYTFVPLGFTFLGRDAVFINDNSSIENINGIMSAYRNKSNINAYTSMRKRMYQAFTDEKFEMLNKKISNIQVVVKSSTANHYELSIIGKNEIIKLTDCKKHFNNIEKIYVKDGDKFISIYDEVFSNILYNQSQYALINKLIHRSVVNEKINYVKDILMIEIIFRGGKNVDDLKKNVDIAYAVGKDMRSKITNGILEKDIDNGLRGLVYNLSNSLSVGNKDEYLNVIIRIYSGKGIPIPYIFKETYQSNEMFKAIGTGFILGLKYSKYEKTTNNEEEKNDD